MKSASNKSLTILVAILALFICGSAFANNGKGKPEVKLPVFKNAADIKFDADDQNFFVWLNKYFADQAAVLKDFEKDPEIYEKRFRMTKSRFRRLWKGYKESKKLGEALVVEVKLRLKRNDILEKFKAAEDKKNKDRFRAELTRVVSKEFDSAMAIKRIRYQDISSRINWLSKELAKRQDEVKQLVEHKDSEVNKRVDQLIKNPAIVWTYPKNKGVASINNPNLKLKDSKDIKFAEDDNKFFVWLYRFFPDYAKDIKDLENNPQEYQKKFKEYRIMFRRLWRGYKFNREYGKTLVQEVELRVERFGVLKKLQAAKSNEQKTKIRDDLIKVVYKEFDVAVKVKKLEYEGLKRRIKWFQRRLVKREDEVKKLVANKSQEVKNRVEDLITGEEKINWK